MKDESRMEESLLILMQIMSRRKKHESYLRVSRLVFLADMMMFWCTGRFFFCFFIATGHAVWTFLQRVHIEWSGNHLFLWCVILDACKFHTTSTNFVNRFFFFYPFDVRNLFVMENVDVSISSSFQRDFVVCQPCRRRLLLVRHFRFWIYSFD